MTAPVSVSERDLRILAGIVSDDRPDLPADGGLPLSLLADLTDQIRCDEVQFCGFDSGRESYWFLHNIGARPISRPRRGRRWTGCTGGTTGTASPAATPTAPATCAAS
jgi:hypothetical protein